MNKRTKDVIKNYAPTLVLAVIAGILIRSFVLETFRIPNSAMRPNLLSGDTVFVFKLPYQLGTSNIPSRGDIIVFSGDNKAGDNTIQFIKRVVGIPGDSISFKEGTLLLNNQPMNKPEAAAEVCPIETAGNQSSYQICKDAPIMEDIAPMTVPEGSVFVMSDLRTQKNLITSTNEEKIRRIGWGIIPISAIEGRAFAIWLSFEPYYDAKPHGGWLPQLRWDRILKKI